MKKHVLLFVFTLFIFISKAQTQFWSDTFEDVGAPSSGVRIPSVTFNASNERYFDRVALAQVNTSTVYTSFQGTKFWGGADIDNITGQNTQSAFQNVTWSSINIVGKTGLSFKGFFAIGNSSNFDHFPGLSTIDYMLVEYRIDAGAWTNLVRFFPNLANSGAGALAQELTGDSLAQGEGPALNSIFTEFSANIAGTGTTLDLRFKCFANGTSFEEIAVDNFRLFEAPACPTPTLNLVGQTNVLCNGGSNGSATVSASGAAPFTYIWSPSGGNAATASGLSAGVYTCVTTNSCGLTASRTVTITQPASALNTSTAITNVLCNGGTTGSATVTANGGTPGYSYLWSSAQTTSVISGLNAGVRTVTVTDANGCTSIKSITISQPATALSTSTAVTNVLCNGGSSGSATVTASGGTGAYTYLWSSAQTTSVITGLNAGVRTVTVTDANGCTSIKSIAISQPATAVSTSTAITNISCNGGSNGSATVTATSGTPGYTYLWSTAATTSVISGQTSGVKTITVTDANGCTSINSVNITQPASALNTSTAITNVLCNGGSTGSATVSASGGAPGYIYLWSSAQTTSVISGLNAGVRTVTVTDANGCTSIKSITITQPATAVSTSTAQTNVLCNGGSTGSATVTASGGTPGYTYLWSTAATTSVISSQTSGVKTVTVTDANGCTTINSVNITQPATAVSSSTSVVNILCNGGNNGSATVIASGGTPGYTYLWSTAATTSVISSQTSGVKTVTVTDANGCTTINSVNISQPASALNTATAITNVLCNGGTGSATITASGGTAGYTYLWSNAATTSVIASVLAGAYTATVTDANGCTSIKSVSITQPSAITASIASTTAPGCSLNNGAITVSASGGTGSLSYSWSPIGGTSATGTNLTAGSYICTITDANNCTLNISQSLSNPNSPTVTASTSNAGCALQTNGSITLTVTGGTPAYSYTWSPSVSTTSVATTLGAGVYNATVTDANNCITTQSYTLTAFPLPTVTATNSNSVFCIGGSVTLSGNGATTYTWSGGVINNTAFTPTATSNYTVTGIDSNGCTNTTLTSVTVNPLPTVSAITSSSVICGPPGQQTCTLTASAANTYTWNPGGTGTSIAISPSVTSTYTVTGTDANGCINSSIITQSVSACTGFSELLTTNSELIIYPNPTNGEIIISGVLENTHIEMYNVIGELILTEKLLPTATVLSAVASAKGDNLTLDLTQQPNGIYFIKIGSEIRKIIKQ